MSTLKISKKSCLIVTYGPVPTSEYKRVEGGGMRAWGLAKGLRANGARVTVAVNSSFPQSIGQYEDVNLTNWSLDHKFVDLINSYDMVIISYCMGDPSTFVAKYISPEVQLVLDAYVPIYVEVSARDSDDIPTEYTHYMDDIKGFNTVLKRGDYFLCANELQKIYYTGVLSSLGIVNPYSYRKDRILVVPFGIHDDQATATYNPYEKLGLKEDDFVVLWFGGIYPWFNVSDLLDAALKLSKIDDIKLVFVGGKNPFNPNPDFSKQYDSAVDFANQHKLTDKSIFFVDWVDFNERANWYKHADLVISINEPGEENNFSWRTRVMDYVWGELAIVTNGQDALSEELISEKAAIRFDSLSANSIYDKIVELHNNPAKLNSIRQKIVGVKSRYLWKDVVAPIISVPANKHPFQEEVNFKLNLPQNSQTALSSLKTIVHKGLTIPKRAVMLVPKTIKYGRERGWKRLYYVTSKRLPKFNPSHPKKYYFISHSIDHTGAPQVMVQIIKEYVSKYGSSQIIVVSPHIEKSLLMELRELGVKFQLAHSSWDVKEIALQLGIQKNDYVLMNTVAVLENYRNYILESLKKGTLRHAYWFIHEDKTQSEVINRGLNSKLNFKEIGELVNNNKLAVFVPSASVMRQYNQILKTKKVKTVLLNIGVENKYHLKRKEDDFKKIDFLLQGTPEDGRKGHFITLIAFDKFIRKYYSKNPEQYRDFSLHLVSISNDYVSRQIKAIGSDILGKKMQIYESMPKSKVLNVYSKCNAVICTSLSETFALYVAESMFMGSVVLRNSSAGSDEQLINGKNGYKLSMFDTDQIASVIEKILNKKKTSDKALLEMGKTSQEIISKYSGHKYIKQIEKSTSTSNTFTFLF